MANGFAEVANMQMNLAAQPKEVARVTVNALSNNFMKLLQVKLKLQEFFSADRSKVNKVWICGRATILYLPLHIKSHQTAICAQAIALGIISLIFLILSAIELTT